MFSLSGNTNSGTVEILPETRISLCTLGFDIKIRPDGRPYIIEVNGYNSGIEGLKAISPRGTVVFERDRAKEAAIAKNRETLKSATLSTRRGILDVLTSVTADMDIATRISTMSHRILIESEFALPENDPERYKNSIHPMPEALERATNNKRKTKDYMNPSYLAPYFVWMGAREDLHTFMFNLTHQKNHTIDLERYPYVVAKANHGSHGDNVRIFHISDIEAIVSFLQSFKPGKAMVEAFIDSKAINGYQDGCMRYLVDFTSFHPKESSLTSWRKNFIGVYWRISPGNGVTGNPNIDFKANLTGANPALPVHASQEDINIAEIAVDDTIDRLVSDRSLFFPKQQNG